MIDGNSSLGNHCVDLQNFGVSQTSSLVSTPKFCKNSTSTTANTSIVCNGALDSANRTNLHENAESQSNNRSNGSVALRCFDAERAKIGLERPLSEVSYQNNANEYPRTNCTQETNALKSTKCGFIALIGRPNAGKSTLLNALINENLALTSHKVNATRKQCNIIVTHKNAQMIFIDTPGLHKSQKLLNALMVDESHKAIESCDIVAFLAPISDDLAHYEAFLEIANDKKHIVLLTKIDLTNKANLLKKLESYQKYSSKFEAIIPISATKRVNLEQIFGAICAHLPNSPFLYDSEILTSTHIREIYREKIRESLFNFTNKEVPYSSEVRILRILESENLTKIYAEIITEKTSQKKIIIGQGGKRIKNIGIDARKKIEEFSGERVFLSLNVVCERGWSKDKKAIEKMMS